MKKLLVNNVMLDHAKSCKSCKIQKRRIITFRQNESLWKAHSHPSGFVPTPIGPTYLESWPVSSDWVPLPFEGFLQTTGRFFRSTHFFCKEVKQDIASIFQEWNMQTQSQKMRRIPVLFRSWEIKWSNEKVVLKRNLWKIWKLNSNCLKKLAL